MILSEEHLMIRDAVRDFAERELKPKAAQLDKEGRFPAEILAEMGKLGFLGIPFEEKWGGAGADNLSYAIGVEEISRVCGSTGLTMAAHISLGTYPLWKYGTDEQKEAYLPNLVSGKYIGAFGLTEPNAGSDAGGTETRAVRDGDSYVINGTKIWMTSGDKAGLITMTARTGTEDKGTRGISAFLVEQGTPGQTVAKHEDKLGMRGSSTVEMVYEDCRIPTNRILGEEGEGFRIFMDTLDGGRISIGALALGIAQGSFEAAV
ncbi:MAG: acyl-CoA dehydrogenase family protein, partial [Candidatus Eisenbacteria bacterium]|nr:acyl-CoA dehydrogenase family protein [Candidatus Eisenbacteria bacterium]